MARTKHALKNEQGVFDQLKAIIWEYNFDYLAAASGVCRATLYNWCDGRTKLPRLDTLVKVAKVVGYKIILVKADKKSHLRIVK